MGAVEVSVIMGRGFIFDRLLRLLICSTVCAAGELYLYFFASTVLRAAGNIVLSWSSWPNMKIVERVFAAGMVNWLVGRWVCW